MPQPRNRKKPPPDAMFELRRAFLALKTPEQLGRLLGVSYGALVYHLYKTSPAARYETFSIPKKSGGARTITAPVTALKYIQRNLCVILNAVYCVRPGRTGELEVAPRPSAHGFVPGRSIRTNAACHSGKRFVLNLDLKDFFPSVNFGRVRGLFMGVPYNLPPPVATVIAQICCYKDGERDELPQGAPTSPIITNMICSRLDSQLQRLAGEFRLTYTRYADDITFSATHKSFPADLASTAMPDQRGPARVGHRIRQIVQDNGFSVHEKKVRLLDRRFRQEVTGLTVNEFPNVTRSYTNRTRAMLYAWEKFGLEGAERRFHEIEASKAAVVTERRVSFTMCLRGRIEYIGMVRGKEDPRYVQLLGRFKTLLDPTAPSTSGVSEQQVLKEEIVAELTRRLEEIREAGPEKDRLQREIKRLERQLRRTRTSVAALYKGNRRVQDGQDRSDSSATEAQRLELLIHGLRVELLSEIDERLEKIGSPIDFQFVEEVELRRGLEKFGRKMGEAESEAQLPEFCLAAFNLLHIMVTHKLRAFSREEQVRFKRHIASIPPIPADSGSGGSPKPSPSAKLTNPEVLRIAFVLAHGMVREFGGPGSPKHFYLFLNVLHFRNLESHPEGGVRVSDAIKRISGQKKKYMQSFLKAWPESREEVINALPALLERTYRFCGEISDLIGAPPAERPPSGDDGGKL